MTRREITLAEGRALEVEVTGPDDGPVLVFQHGTPGTAHQARFLQRAVHARGWRLATFSRPGYGGSGRLPGRSVADVAADTAALLDDLGASQAFVAGASGGGPHTLACAALLPGRVRAALVISGVAPYEADGLDFLAGMGEDNLAEFGAADEGEPAVRAFLQQMLPQLGEASAEQIVEQLASLLPPVDRAVITGEMGDDMAESFHQVAAGGASGWVDDDLAFVRPWGFDLASITVPVSLWQGTEDLMVPVAHGRWLAERVPGVHAHIEPGEGHLSLSVAGIDRMLDELGGLG